MKVLGASKWQRHWAFDRPIRPTSNPRHSLQSKMMKTMEIMMRMNGWEAEANEKPIQRECRDKLRRVKYQMIQTHRESKAGKKKVWVMTTMMAMMIQCWQKMKYWCDDSGKTRRRQVKKIMMVKKLGMT